MAVYFIEAEKTGLIKIGKTDDVVNRITNLQAESPDRLVLLAVIEDATNDRPYQRKFASAWSHSEWFNPVPELKAFIGTIPETKYAGLCIRVRNLQSDVKGHMSDADWENWLASRKTRGRLLKATEREKEIRSHVQQWRQQVRDDFAEELEKEGEPYTAQEIRRGRVDDLVSEMVLEGRSWDEVSKSTSFSKKQQSRGTEACS